jgi:RND family efflux transporter MFP subunit
MAMALGLAAVMAAPAALAQTGGTPPVTVARPVVKPIVEWDEFIGRFEAVDSVDIRSRVPGYIEKVHFTDGEQVMEGDLLFTIDQRSYQAALEDARAAIASAKARLDFAQSDLERAEQLRKNGTISEQVVDQRKQTFLSARGDYDRAAAAQRQAELNMEYTEIRAPFAGRVSRRLVSVGNLVNANETVLTNVVSQDPIYFYFETDERSYLAYVQQALQGRRPGGNPDGPVRITVDNRAAGEIVGRMDFVDNRMDAASGTMRGRAIVENKNLGLTPGQFGRIRIIGSGEYQGVLVPDEAVGSDQDRRIVYVVDKDNIVSTKAVRTGPRIDGYRVIREGLDGSETIVVNGLTRVRPGVKVMPQSIVLPLVRTAQN